MATHAGPEEHSGPHRLTRADFDALFKQLRDATARGPEDRRGTLNNLTPAHVLAAIEEVVECWEVSGTVDYVARFVCADLAGYQALTTQLIDDSSLGIARIVSHVALRAVRPFGGYPESLLVRKPA
jgi:DNA-binding Lrp family transcriptional regulator